MTDLTPRPEHHFTFGLWTVGNPGRDPFGHEVRAAVDPVDTVHRLAELGAYGVNFHDDDLVPPGSSAGERDAVVNRLRTALDETGMKVPMATTDLFSRPVFKEGVDVLLGDVVPSARMPFSIPADDSDLPDFDRDATSFRYDRWHGWWRLRHGTPPSRSMASRSAAAATRSWRPARSATPASATARRSCSCTPSSRSTTAPIACRLRPGRGARRRHR